MKESVKSGTRPWVELNEGEKEGGKEKKGKGLKIAIQKRPARQYFNQQISGKKTVNWAPYTAQTTNLLWGRPELTNRGGKRHLGENLPPESKGRRSC